MARTTGDVAPGPCALGTLLERAAASWHDRPCVTVGGKTLSFADAGAAAATRAGGLYEAGLRQGDRIALALPTGRELVELILGGAWLGAALVPLSTELRRPQFEHALERTQPQALVLAPRVTGELAGLHHLVPRVWSTTDTAELAPVPVRGSPLPPAQVDPRDPFAILMTSGTTGPSKGVVCPHSQFWWWGVNTAAVLDVSGDDVLHTTLPLTHTNALNTLVQGLIHGAHVVLEERFSASRFWERVVDSGATVTYILGAMASILARRDPSPRDRAHRVRVALAPATPAPLWPVFEARFGIRLVEGHGMTETNLCIGPRDGVQRPGWMGRTMPGFAARVIDPSGAGAPDGEPGELVLRAVEQSAFADGYVNDPEATAAAWRDGWFRTGDRVVRDADGWYRFVDRAKDSIRRRGENVSAWEVEQALLANPDVGAVAAVAVPSDLSEDDVMIFVVPRGDPPDPAELAVWCAERLPAYAVPRYVEVVESLPLTDNGKVRKHVLRERGVSSSTWDREAAGAAKRSR